MGIFIKLNYLWDLQATALPLQGKFATGQSAQIHFAPG
jgi:hypothetical protein